MMTAKEARDLAMSKLKENMAQQRVRISRKIEMAANQSQNGIELSELIFKDIKKELKEKGYKMAEKSVESGGWKSLIIW